MAEEEWSHDRGEWQSSGYGTSCEEGQVPGKEMGKKMVVFLLPTSLTVIQWNSVHFGGDLEDFFRDDGLKSIKMVMGRQCKMEQAMAVVSSTLSWI